MIICLLSDSLSLPRKLEQVNLKYRETYPYLTNEILKEKVADCDFDFIPLGNRGRTIYLTNKQLTSEVFNYDPDIVVLQVGIVDCAPRVFSRWEQIIIRKLGPLNKPIVDYAHSHRRRIITIMPPKVYVKYEKFVLIANKLRSSILDHAKVLLVINIAPTIPDTTYRSPGLEQNINQYNQVLASICDGTRVRLVDIHSEIKQKGVDRMILEDGIHLSKSGNELLADKLSEELLNTISWLEEEGMLGKSVH